MKRLVIFDLDGTILDTSDDLCAAINYSLQKSGLPLKTRDDVVAATGNGIRRLVELCLPSPFDGSVAEKVFSDFKSYYFTHCCDRTRPYDGVSELLSALKTKGCLLAVSTNKAYEAAQSLIDRHFFGLFDVVVGQTEALAKKPDPASVFFIGDYLDIPIGETVFVGDSEIDIATARRAGIPCVSVSWGFRSENSLLSAGAETIVRTPKEVLSLPFFK